ncbi:MtfA peptidase [Planctomycetaceae bacterium]|nr:MtfA peptidase [Planctomycetaceae bacterium]
MLLAARERRRASYAVDMFGILKNRRRAKLMQTPLPQAWREFINLNAPLCTRLPAPLRAELEGRVQVFLAEKEFESCAGQPITDEVRVTVAALACLLLLNRENDNYPQMGSILVYPNAFRVKHRHVDEHGFETEVDEENLGEAWERGSVILSWDDALIDAREPDDGFNVAIHEFAHQLDMEDGYPNGTPLLADKGKYQRWQEVMTREYEALRKTAATMEHVSVEEWEWELRPRHEHIEVLDVYGAEDPAEFFAVATEAFFEDARRLKSHHPELYAVLSDYYCLDPAAWARP